MIKKNVGQMKEAKPFMFEVDRGDGEKLKIMYSKTSDMFFQLQESVNETSLFVGKSVMRGKLVHHNFFRDQSLSCH
jgi:hypothetical protein